MRTSKIQILLAACLLFVSLGASAETPDGERFWTTVGSAGTLDEKSEGMVFFDRAVVQMGERLIVDRVRYQPRAQGGIEETQSAVIRYNVTAVDGLFGGEQVMMQVRFLAEGVSARVVANLIEIDFLTGAETTLLTFDSDDFSAASGYHTEEVRVCTGRKQPFDFVRHAYYIEATLTNSSFVAPSAAGIEVIHVQAVGCPG
jgi:hypothetical protein